MTGPAGPSGGSSVLGPVLVVVGAAVVVVGLLVWTGALDWFGRLPGDLNVQRDGLRVWIPITSMLLVSAVLSLLLWLLRRLF